MVYKKLHIRNQNMALIFFSAFLLTGNIILFYIIFCHKSKTQTEETKRDSIIWKPSKLDNTKEIIKYENDKSANIDLTEGIDVEYDNKEVPATSDVSEKVIKIKNYKTNIEYSNRLI